MVDFNFRIVFFTELYNSNLRGVIDLYHLLLDLCDFLDLLLDNLGDLCPLFLGGGLLDDSTQLLDGFLHNLDLFLQLLDSGFGLLFNGDDVRGDHFLHISDLVSYAALYLDDLASQLVVLLDQCVSDLDRFCNLDCILDFFNLLFLFFQ